MGLSVPVQVASTNKNFTSLTTYDVTGLGFVQSAVIQGGVASGAAFAMNHLLSEGLKFILPNCKYGMTQSFEMGRPGRSPLYLFRTHAQHTRALFPRLIEI